MRHFCNANVSCMGQCRGSRFTHYTTHVPPNYKTIFFTERGNRTHRYMLEPIPLSAIQTIASMRLSSHALRCETGVGAQVMRVAGYAHFALNKFESLSITLWYNAHIQPCFPHLFDWVQSLHEFLSQPQCALSIATFIGKVLEHRE